MPKYFSIDGLRDSLEEDLTWRIKEISTLKRAVEGASASEKDLYLRSFVAMLYAHWEGYATSSTNNFLKFIFSGKHKFSELKPCFSLVRHRRLISSLREGSGYKKELDILMSVLNSQNESAKPGRHEKIKTRGNINTSIIQEICFLLGIDSEIFNEKFDFIDRELLAKRNAIAHGQSATIKEEDTDRYRENVLWLMRTLKNEIENQALDEKFKLN